MHGSAPALIAPNAEETTLDRLAADWWIYQLRRGHRYNTDDVLTAWAAVRARPRAGRVLDLGAGVGAIGLLSLVVLPSVTRLVSIEVQQRSVALARRTVAHNGLADRVDLRHGDLRCPDVLADVGPFDLVVANPPYLRPGAAVPSPHPQRAAARMELHGDVFDYCRCAASHLGANGRLVVCHAAADPRPSEAIRAAGLALLERRPVCFRRGKAPTIALYLAGWGPLPSVPEAAATLCIRDESGRFTEDWMTIRRHMLIA